MTLKCKCCDIGPQLCTTY